MPKVEYTAKPKKAIRKKKTSDDLKKYHPRRDPSRAKNTNTSSFNLVHARTTQAADKISVMVEINKTPDSYNEVQFKNLLYRKIENNPYFRPIKKVISYSKDGSPLEVETPQGKTALKRTTKIGEIDVNGQGIAISFFSNDADAVPLASVPEYTFPPEHPLFASTTYQSTVKVETDQKEQSITVNPALVAATQREKARSVTTRSQRRVLAESSQVEKHVSANQFSKAAGIGIPSEIAHLVAHDVAGAATQTPDNLVITSKGANTEMMFVEKLHRYLLKHYAEYQLITSAQLYGKTHLAKKIHYEIKTTDFEFKLTFIGQNENTPHIAYQQIIRALLQTYVELAPSKQLAAQAEKGKEPDDDIILRLERETRPHYRNTGAMVFFKKPSTAPSARKKLFPEITDPNDKPKSSTP